jgi:hypothetical protein
VRALDPPLESGRARATWTIGLLALCSAVAAVDLVQQAVRLFQLNRLGGTCVTVPSPTCRPVDAAHTVAAINHLDGRARALLNTELVLLLIAGIAWLVWQHRSQRLLSERLEAPGLRFTPGWAVGWWFVPLANLGVPPVAVSELWRASGGADGPGSPWRARPVPAALRWWWAFVVASVAVAAVTRGQSDPASASFADVRANCAALVLGCAALVVAGILAIAVVRSVELRLERARPYPEETRPASSGDPGREGGGDVGPAPGAAPDGSAETPPRRGRVGALATLAAVTVAAAVVVAATSPSITPVERPDAGAPSPVATFLPPAGWHVFGDASIGFVLSAPPGWHETHDGTPALLRLEPTDGADAICFVIDDVASGGAPLRDVVADLLSQIHDPGIYDLAGGVDVQPLTVPAGAAERLRFTAHTSGRERSYVQYVLVNAEAGWLIGCDAPDRDAGALEPVFERMISTFRFR